MRIWPILLLFAVVGAAAEPTEEDALKLYKVAVEKWWPEAKRARLVGKIEKDFPGTATLRIVHWHELMFAAVARPEAARFLAKSVRKGVDNVSALAEGDADLETLKLVKGTLEILFRFRNEEVYSYIKPLDRDRLISALDHVPGKDQIFVPREISDEELAPALDHTTQVEKGLILKAKEILETERTLDAFAQARARATILSLKKAEDLKLDTLALLCHQIYLAEDMLAGEGKTRDVIEKLLLPRLATAREAAGEYSEIGANLESREENLREVLAELDKAD